MRICSNVNGIPSIQSIPIISAHFFLRRSVKIVSRSCFCFAVTGPLISKSQLWMFVLPPLLSLMDFPYSCSIVKCLSRTLVKGVSAVGNPVSSISPNLHSVIGKLSRFGLSLMLPTIYILFRSCGTPKYLELSTRKSNL